jgi:hypothetical protein
VALAAHDGGIGESGHRWQKQSHVDELEQFQSMSHDASIEGYLIY